MYNRMSSKLYLSFALLFVFFAACKAPQKEQQVVKYIHNDGVAQGTFYSATYLQPEGKDLKAQIDTFFSEFDRSLSNYNPNSIISRINKNDPTVKTDAYFKKMFETAMYVSEKTNGAFDITVNPLVSAWGFGAAKKDRNSAPDIKSILSLVGYKKVKLIDGVVVKSDPRITLDAGGIGQGFSADLIAGIFEKNGCENYMIDIGGEIVCKGVNPDGSNWKIGIDKPVDDPDNASVELQAIVGITNKALTTSGNYRQFYYKDGKKYAHTIDPKTGYPVGHSLLSATIIADNCIVADAYATAFMVVGKDSAMAICKRTLGMDCYLIYTDEKGKYQVEYTEGFKKYLVE